ncbi:MAG TPA: serine hydrolase, partial [Armatimonadota bacterium]|nr:serine hydrolase [Armatimonadota bacterium]
ADAQCTLRDLVSHRTGLSRHDMLWFGSPWSREEVIRKIGLVKLNRPFRSSFQYQNIAFATAGYAVGTASKSSWEAFVQKRLLDPLGMTATDLSIEAAQKSPDHATPHVKEEDGALKAVPWRGLENCAPAGAINSTARDLTRWVRFQLGDGTWEGKRLVSAAALEETKTPQMVVRIEGSAKQTAVETETTQRSYGMGWFIEDYRGQLLVSHGGNIDGFTTRIALLPRAKLGIVVLANLNGTLFNTAVSHGITDLALGLPRKDWNGYYAGVMKRGEGAATAARKEMEEKRHRDTKPSRDLSAYAGTYEEPAYGTATVTLEEGSLVLQWSRFRNRLEHW